MARAAGRTWATFEAWGAGAMSRNLEGSAVPTLSVGLPVYNGADFVAEAIESILSQSFTDFELLIQDNASTDATEDICRSYAAIDARVHYVRNPQNVGAAPNYNLVFERARGRYFKWAAHDDVCMPDFFERCVEALERESAAVLCCGQTQLINDDGSSVSYDIEQRCYVTRHGERVGRIDPLHRAEGTRPFGRFWDVLVRTMRTFEIFGVIRADVLRKTHLHRSYYGSDKVLLAQLSLLGRFHLLPEVLLLRRCHRNQSSNLALTQKGNWIGGGKAPGWLILRLQKVIPGYIEVVQGAPISLTDKVACYGAIVYRLIAPQTWIKQFLPGRYTET
jgi:glycosyltransferase involved in cell wall biosynthesis